MKLNINNLIWKRHKTDQHDLRESAISQYSKVGKDHRLTTHVHGNRYNHKFCIEADERSVFCKAVIFNQSLSDSAKKEVVQASINDANNDFRCSIPISVDINEAVLC